ncbi:MAG TPA: DUF1134 domain-containing protein [Caulobacteraceae bacterium]|jgi:hypothetical protein|nr:DUF1134 domain-containing protein [Caulobacteraceae bacterium]
MDRRLLLASGLALLGAGAAKAQPAPGSEPEYDRDRDNGMPQPGLQPAEPTYPTGQRADTYKEDELAHSVSDFFGVTAETAGAIIEKAFKDNGDPTGYIAGTEGSGAFFGGLRYGSGLLYMKNRRPQKVFWQGPSIGWDFGGNASRVFTLCYNLQYGDMIYRRFPGIEGTAYFIGGLGINYQRAEDVTLAPIRAGVGLRLGANAGYLAYTRSRHIIPL